MSHEFAIVIYRIIPSFVVLSFAAIFLFVLFCPFQFAFVLLSRIRRVSLAARLHFRHIVGQQQHRLQPLPRVMRGPRNETETEKKR